MKITETNLQFKNALTKRSKTEKIATHHAAAKVCDAKTIHGWHLNNGWSGIGYHFVVRKNGTIERGRPIDKVGAHCTGHNSNTIGICFEGNFQKEKMSDVQLKAGQELIAYLLDLYNLKKSDVVRHKDLIATSCPGKNFPFAKMVSGANKILSAENKTANSKKTTVTKFKGYNVRITPKIGVNIRKGASASHKKLGAIPYNKKVYISKESNGWGYTEYNGIKGWIYLSNTKKVK